MKAQKLAIIILQHNTPEHVTNNLRKLQEAELPKETEIIVVDNGEKGANKKIPKEVTTGLNVTFYDSPNNGFPAGNNFGLSKLKHDKDYYDFFAFLNPDIQVNPDTIKTLIEYMEERPEVGLTSPTLRYADGTIQDNYRVFPKTLDFAIKRIPALRKRFSYRMREYLMWDRNPHTNEAVDWVVGAFTVLSKNCMKAIGKHDDERYFLFMSDVVLCRDAWEQGYEVHIVGDVEALHNDQRLSSGGVKDVFKRKIIRLHIKDALSYIKHYAFKKLPKNCPSRKRQERRQRLMKAKKLNNKHLQINSLNNKLQKNNPVVDVYTGNTVGKINYQQPVIFFGNSSSTVVKNEKGEYGLIKIWRHTPLQLQRKNTFPILPDLGDLGLYSYETVRGGVDKSNEKAIEASRKELREEIGLTDKDIINSKSLGYAIGNTAIDIYKHEVFEVTIKNSFKAPKFDEKDGIIDFQFFTKDQIKKMITDKKIVCGLTQASLLQSILLSE